MSEKLDGIRTFWNGQVMVSRHGKNISCPDWFTEKLPRNVSLDGELWMGRGTLEFLEGFIHGKQDSLSWSNIFFMIFDLPSSNKPFEIRTRDMANMTLPLHFGIVDIQQCRGKAHLQQSLANILDNGGEGLMVNRPESLYIATRTESLLKVKV